MLDTPQDWLCSAERPPTNEVYLNAVIALAYAQIQAARRRMDVLSAREMVALAGMMRLGLDAVRQRDEWERAARDEGAAPPSPRLAAG